MIYLHKHTLGSAEQNLNTTGLDHKSDERSKSVDIMPRMIAAQYYVIIFAAHEEEICVDGNALPRRFEGLSQNTSNPRKLLRGAVNLLIFA